MLGENFSRQNFEICFLFFLKYFSYFSQKTGFDTSCKLSSKETICMMCQILFSWKNKKNIITLSSAESAHSMVLTLVLLNKMPRPLLIVSPSDF